MARGTPGDEPDRAPEHDPDQAPDGAADQVPGGVMDLVPGGAADSTPGEGRTAAPGERPAGGLFGVLGWVLGAALLPGLAHLRARRQVAGTLIMSCYLAGVCGAGAVLLTYRQELRSLALQRSWLIAATVVAVAAGLAWAAVVVRSYVLLARPARLRRPARIVGAAVTALLAVAVAAPLGVTAQYANKGREGLEHIFDGASASTRTGDDLADDPWRGRTRVNILLVGGDAARNRYGVRTDSMTLASIDVRTGRTVLLSLPRNLEGVPMPAGRLRAAFPQGFSALLNEAYQYAVEHPELTSRSRHRGGELLKGIFAEVLGIPVDYYMMIDMRGFARIVDGLGGVRLKVDQPIPWGLEGDVIPAGDRVLNGTQALWYGRSRINSDDYVRMGRQKCLLRALVRQANPGRVLRSFNALVEATKRTISTDIPRPLLPHLVDLADKVKAANMTSVQFVPPLVDVTAPDWSFIRGRTHAAITEAERPPGNVDKPPPTGAPRPKPKADSLDAICPN